MTSTNEHDVEAIRKTVVPNDVMPMVDDGIVELGGNPKMVTTIKAWPPGKPPGGQLPTPQPEAKDQQQQS